MADINSELNRFNGTSNDALMLRNSLEGSTDPSTATKGFVGQIYVNSSTGDTFVCKSASTGNYVWIGLGNKLFDIIIQTQAQFEALIASPTWLDAKSVCFIGDGGALKFTRSDGLGCKIPQTVKNIQGLNTAIIEVTNLVQSDTSNKAALWYQTLPNTNDYWIDGLTINCTGPNYTHGFAFCTHLTNCSCVSANNSGYSSGGFWYCNYLTNCIGTGDSSGYNSIGFSNCNYLTNCIGTGSSKSGANAYGFGGCKGLTNCIGIGSDAVESSCGFNGCIILANCSGKGNSSGTKNYGFYNCEQIVNCDAVGSGTGVGSSGYGFYGCSYLSNCKQPSSFSEGTSTTAFLGGPNTHVCTETVAAT